LGGTVMVAVSALSFGSLSVFSRHLAAVGVAVPLMLAARFTGGALVLWGLSFARGEVRRLTLREWSWFCALGLLYVGEAWTYFESAQRINVALTALLLYLYPAIVAALSFALWREALGRLGVAALGLSSAGVAMAVGGAPAGVTSQLGLALGVATAFIYSAYVLIGARAPKAVPASLGSAWLMTIAAVVFSSAALLTGTFEPGRLAQAPGDLAGMVLLGTAIPIPLLLAGIARVGPTRGAIISSLEPISAAVLGATFLDEPLGWPQVAGVALVVSALVVLARRPTAVAAP
jgi:drug/metabolite transporter (DMT)-like permease